MARQMTNCMNNSGAHRSVRVGDECYDDELIAQSARHCGHSSRVSSPSALHCTCLSSPLPICSGFCLVYPVHCTVCFIRWWIFLFHSPRIAVQLNDCTCLRLLYCHVRAHLKQRGQIAVYWSFLVCTQKPAHGESDLIVIMKSRDTPINWMRFQI